MQTEDFTVPTVRDLATAMAGVRGVMATVDRHRRSTATNAQGGDCGHHASSALTIRHTVNYLLAADVASRVDAPGPLLDVGSGVGTFSAWLARRLDRPLHLADHDPHVRDLARRAFRHAEVHDDVAAAPHAAVVTAMEVIEHLPYAAQVPFVRSLVNRLRPGGVLVCSTPDERNYLGGWSGYGPHVGTLDFDGLATLLRQTTGLPATVYRIDGPGFARSPAQRVLEPIGNRLWGTAQRLAPPVVGRVETVVGARRRRRHGPLPPAPPDAAFTVSTAGGGRGTGLLGVVRRPPT